MDVEKVQLSWDRQQETYMPDREDRLALMLDLVAAQAGSTPRILDLAGGTGSITRRLLARFPDARSVVLDTDPVLLAIAGATFDDDPRVSVVDADLTRPDWTDALAGHGPFDSVLTATALHWLTPEQVSAVYRDARALLRPGGLFANADHMPDPGLPGLSARVADLDHERATRIRDDTGAADWAQWWSELRDEPALVDAFSVRDRTPHDHDHTRSTESSTWHVSSLDAAGYTETGLFWRSRLDALAVGIAP